MVGDHGARGWKRIMSGVVTAVLLLPVPAFATISFNGYSVSNNQLGPFSSINNPGGGGTLEFDLPSGNIQTSATVTVFMYVSYDGNGSALLTGSWSQSAYTSTFLTGPVAVLIETSNNSMFSNPAASTLPPSGSFTSQPLNTGSNQVKIQFQFSSSNFQTISSTPMTLTFSQG